MSQNECHVPQSYGEDVLAADGSLLGRHSKPTLTEWNKSCERLFKFVTIRCSASGFGNGVTVVISDSRCNEHITKNGCVERPVRLPTALKAAKMAGAGSTPSFPFKNGVDDHYMKLATDKFLEKAHTVAYLKKIKAKCTAIAPDASGAQLTEASDGEGGCDTSKSRKSPSTSATCIVLGLNRCFVSFSWIKGNVGCGSCRHRCCDESCRLDCRWPVC